MTFSIHSTSFQTEGLNIDQYEFDVEDQDFNHNIPIYTHEEEDVFALVQIEGEVEVETSGIEMTDFARSPGEMSFEGSQPAGLFLRFRSGGKARVIVGKVWRGIKRTAVKIGCKGCKSAVMWLIRSVFALAGVPFPNPAEDLSAVSTTIQAAIDQIQAGKAPAALLHLLNVLPSGIFDALKYAFHAINWIWDAVDKFCEEVCRRIALCP